MFAISDATGGYGKTTILRDVCINVADGEIVALLGRNGAGKSTLLKYAMGLIDVFGGTVSLAGARAATCRITPRTRRSRIRPARAICFSAADGS